MASINDFKLINAKAHKCFELLLNNFNNNVVTEKAKILTEIEKNRLGFYIFALEYLTGISDIDTLSEIITDSDFNKFFYDDCFDDFGVDAIFIDHDTRAINLFNFKFREKYNIDRQQSTNDFLVSQKFTNLLKNYLDSDNLEEIENREELRNKIGTYFREIINLLRSNEMWNINLYMVSNESKVISESRDPHINDLKNIIDLSVKPIGIDELRESFFDRPKAKECKFVIEQDAVMSFSETPLDSSKSYIVRIKLSELVRITGKNETLAMEYNIEDVSKLNNLDLDLGILYENVRGFVLKSKYNQNIQSTLKDDGDKFFLYNNGITITTKNLEASPINAKSKLLITLRGFQVINGGQTLRTIHMFNQQNSENINKLNEAQVLVRIFQVKDNDKTENKIAEYTNSQNAISSMDLKSLRDEQIQIENILDYHEIIYTRKTGDLGKNGKSYKNKISMERLGQILFALAGYPEKASDQKKKIFDEYYELLFGDKLDITLVPSYVNIYFEIKSTYQNGNYDFTEQKGFYVLWMNKISNKKNSIEYYINYLEEFLNNYKSNSLVAKSRLLIQVGFRENLLNKMAVDSLI